MFAIVFKTEFWGFCR